jgi:dolichol-phosphate mannosyltransferase
VRGAIASVADLATTLSLLALGFTQGAAHISGTALGGLAYLALRAFLLAGPAAPGGESRVLAGLGGRVFATMLGLALRGGVVASVAALGAPGWLAALAGVTAAWTLYLAGQGAFAAFLEARRAQGLEEPAWVQTTFLFVVSACLLRLVYSGVLPLLPEEAYYWNYSVHLDIGYFDHPPLVAWLIALGNGLLGTTEAGVRIAALLCGLAVVLFIYKLAQRMVDAHSARVAAGLAAVLPCFFGAGLIMTPDAPLFAAWAALLYFLHRALIGEERGAWYAVGIAAGVGLLSKYTIALLGPGVLAFVLLDRGARRWLLRPEPYVAVAIAIVIFAPVIAWNQQHDWASFRFQAADRFDTAPRFSLHLLLLMILVIATPLPLLVMPLLFAKRWTSAAQGGTVPMHADARNRLFIACLVFAPLAVFAWSALRHPPRINWTGPLWLALLPLLGWAIVHARALRWPPLRATLAAGAGPLLAGLLLVYAAFFYYMTLGIPGLSYPRHFARVIGWPGAARQLQGVREQLMKETGSDPVIVGLNSYSIASQLQFHSAHLSEAMADGTRPAEVTTMGSLRGRSSVMYSYWYSSEQYQGRPLILVSRHKRKLETPRMEKHFTKFGPEIQTLALANSGPAGNGQLVDTYYYRTVYGIRPGYGDEPEPE